MGAIAIPGSVPPDPYLQQQMRQRFAPPPPPSVMSAPAAVPDLDSLAAKYGGTASGSSADLDALARKFGGQSVDALGAQAEAAQLRDRPVEQTGFMGRLASSLGLPTTEAEARAMQPSTTEMILGPVATGAKMAYNYGRNIVNAGATGAGEVGEAISNIRHGGPIAPNLGKAGYGTVKGILEGPLSIFGGQGLQQAGEDVAADNLPGAAGGAVGSIINALLLGEAKPESTDAAHLRKINKLSAAVDASGSKVDFPAALSRVSADTEQAMRRAGVDPARATIGQFVDGVNEANRTLENEYSMALAPLAKAQVVPAAEIANVIKGRADDMVAKIPVEADIKKYLNKQAAIYQQPFTLEELDRARKNANARLASYENAATTGKAAIMKKNADVMVDKAIADGARDVIYNTLERHYGQPDYFRNLKQRQSAMMQLQPELEGRLRELSNATAKQKGTPALTGETMHAYGTQHGRVGASVHGLQKTIPLERFNPTGAANLAVRQAFTPPPSMASQATIQALPLRFLLQPQQPSKQGPPPPP